MLLLLHNPNTDFRWTAYLTVLELRLPPGARVVYRHGGNDAPENDCP